MRYQATQKKKVKPLGKWKPLVKKGQWLFDSIYTIRWKKKFWIYYTDESLWVEVQEIFSSVRLFWMILQL